MTAQVRKILKQSTLLQPSNTFKSANPHIMDKCILSIKSHMVMINLCLIIKM